MRQRRLANANSECKKQHTTSSHHIRIQLVLLIARQRRLIGRKAVARMRMRRVRQRDHRGNDLGLVQRGQLGQTLMTDDGARLVHIAKVYRAAALAAPSADRHAAVVDEAGVGTARAKPALHERAEGGGAGGGHAEADFDGGEDGDFGGFVEEDRLGVVEGVDVGEADDGGYAGAEEGVGQF